MKSRDKGNILTSAGEVQGSVFNHPCLPNGEPVRTSILVNPRLAKDGATIKTRSSSMKEQKKRDKEKKDAENVAALQKEKEEKLPGIESDLAEGYPHVEKLKVPRLKDILIFYLGEPSKEVKKMLKQRLLELLKEKMESLSQNAAAAATVG